MHSDREANPKRLRSECKVIARRMQSDREANAKRSRGECKAIAKARNTLKRLQSNFKSDLISDREVTAKML
jgi:hypothetical protein